MEASLGISGRESLEEMNAEKAEEEEIALMVESLPEAVLALYDFIETELDVPAAKKQTLKAF